MQNYNPSSSALQVPASEIRDKLKKRIMTSSPVVVGESATAPMQQQPKATKRSKKDVDSESNGKEEEKPKTNEKHVYKPDPLTTILNEKKASLVRDPEVIALLKKFNQELHKGRTQK